MDNKIIEELAVICGDCENSCDECFSEYEKTIWKHKIKIEDRAKHCQAILHAQRLYNAGYRKLPENAVVIPEKITEETSPEDIIKIAKYNETIRKETAREIAKFVSEHCDDEGLMWVLDEFIAKQYGVEVEE